LNKLNSDLIFTGTYWNIFKSDWR